MNKIIKIIVVLFVLNCVQKLTAQEPALAIQQGIEYHNASRLENGKKSIELIQKSLDTLKPFVETDSIACAYYGSALTVYAGFISETNPIKSLSYLEEGGKYLDKAVVMDKKNSYVHLIRLENGIEVSRTSPVKRYSVIAEDVKYFIDDKNIERLEGENKAECLLYCAYFYCDSGDLDMALDFCDQIIEQESKTEAARLAAKMLAKYSE